MTTSQEVQAYTIRIHQGATWAFSLILTDDNGTAIDLTGYTAKMEIRDMPGGTVFSTLTSSPAAGITITAATGEIDFALTAAQSAALTFGRGQYDIKITSSGGTVTYLLKGDFIVDARVTQ